MDRSRLSIDPEIEQWASTFRETLNPNDPRLRRSAVIFPIGGSVMWLDSTFVIRVNDHVCIFASETTYVYRSEALALCREVTEIQSEVYESVNDVPAWIY